MILAICNEDKDRGTGNPNHFMQQQFTLAQQALEREKEQFQKDKDIFRLEKELFLREKEELHAAVDKYKQKKAKFKQEVLSFEKAKRKFEAQRDEKQPLLRTQDFKEQYEQMQKERDSLELAKAKFLEERHLHENQMAANFMVVLNGTQDQEVQVDNMSQRSQEMEIITDKEFQNNRLIVKPREVRDSESEEDSENSEGYAAVPMIQE